MMMTSLKCKMKVFSLLVIILLLVFEANGGRSSTSNSNTKSSSSSRGSSSTGGGIGSWFGGSKSSSSSGSNSGSSYPKQTWSNSGSSSGSSSKSNSGSSYPKQTWSVGNTGSNSGSSSGSNSGSSSGSNSGSSYPKQTWSNTGTNTGYNQGSNTGYNQGSNTGYNQGSNTGYNQGSNTGYNQGSNTGGNYPRQPPSNPFIGTGSISSTNYAGVNAGNQGNNYRQNSGGQYGQQGGGHYGGQYVQQGGGHYGGQYSQGGQHQSTGQLGWTNPNVGRNYGYYGSGGQSIFGNQYANNNYQKSPFGGFSGTKGLAVGGTAGFAGGAVAGASAVEVYHQYKQYKGLLHCQRYGCGNYRPRNEFGNFGYNHGVLFNHQDCIGGCPNQAYCDYGICRCREGFESRYGQCWTSVDSFNSRQRDWDDRRDRSYNPFRKCSESRQCQSTDMNLVCRSGACECRDDMKWNEEVLECQIFINLSNTIPSDDNSSNGNLSDSILLKNDSSNTNETNEGFESLSLFPIESMTELKNDTGTIETPFDKPINVTSLTPNETLKDSQLTAIDPAKSSQLEIKEAFCREISRTAKRYAPPTVVEIGPLSTIAKVFIIIIACLISLSCCFCCIKNCIINKIKMKRDEKLKKFEQVLPLAAIESTLQDNDTAPTMTQVPYAPGPDNPNPNYPPPPGIYPQNQEVPYGGPEIPGPYIGQGINSFQANAPPDPSFNQGPQGLPYPQGPGYSPSTGFPPGQGGGMVYPTGPHQ